jgi:hypothetical protein
MVSFRLRLTRVLQDRTPAAGLAEARLCAAVAIPFFVITIIDVPDPVSSEADTSTLNTLVDVPV